MRAEDIVIQLAKVLPKFTGDFTSDFNVTSLTRTANVATAVTDVPHGLNVGDQVNITGAQTPIVIESINRNGIVATLVTESNHDMTENDGFNVQIDGANEPEFNGTFELHRVPNRRTIQFIVNDSGPIVATGDPLLLNGSNIYQSYNGLRPVTGVPSADSFEYPLSNATIYPTATGIITARTQPRVTSAVDYETSVLAYTEQPPESAWLFVVLGDSIANKDRNIDIDSTDNIQAGNYFNQRLIQNIQMYVFLPTVDTIAGRQARDRCEELLKPICQTVLGFRFPSLVENSNNPLMITGHGVQDYNSAFYVHRYDFEATIQLGPSDIFTPDDDVAFRDITLTDQLDVGSEPVETKINLDDEPL